MNAKELRQKYLDFFQSKGHTVIPSASLIPENDPTTLFTGSGMQPLVPYLLGEKHPQGNRIADSQKCFRTQDIEEVGDNRHTTVFEMLGNWSLGDYFKRKQIEWIFEFLTKEIELDPNKFYVSVFRGDEKLGIPRDTESVNYWKEQFAKVGIDAKDVDFAERDGMQGGKIFYYDAKKNWWARVMNPDEMPVGEPGGPNSEMFWDFGAELKIHENSRYKKEPCHVNCDCGRFLEIGNNVFMQYVKTKNGFDLLPKQNIDFGGGLERLAAAKNGASDVFLTDLFTPIIEKLEGISGKKYTENEEIKKSFRIISDHLKASTFLISDGAIPSNMKQGYFLRRLIRRAIRYGKMIGIENDFTGEIAEVVIEMYKDAYSELEKKKNKIFAELEKEENKFRKTLERGDKFISQSLSPSISPSISPSPSFEAPIFDSKDLAEKLFIYKTQEGIPLEISTERLKKEGYEITDEIVAIYNEKVKKHQDLSRTASVGMFKGGLVDVSEKTTKLHTAAHLMLAALRQVLGTEVIQRGSNITEERLRFDFSHNAKMTPEQIAEVEKIVNEQIQKKLPVVCKEMTLEEAKKQNAMGVFESKYGKQVKVYSIISPNGGLSSVEICGGPHVKNTGELEKFKIKKEESSSAGVRRIKAVLG
ncbi:alanine--tRNA ligase [Patescibacteria group bacterium]|nr:alanine--tRNA ligase [Patescibacteria group bacterium]